jgi:hypothetical protein
VYVICVRSICFIVYSDIVDIQPVHVPGSGDLGVWVGVFCSSRVHVGLSRFVGQPEVR